MDLISLVTHVLYGTPSQYRTGQFLFNELPAGAQNALAGSMADPFHKELSRQELYEWCNNHLIFDQGRIVAVFVNNHIIWEEA